MRRPPLSTAREFVERYIAAATAPESRSEVGREVLGQRIDLDIRLQLLPLEHLAGGVDLDPGPDTVSATGVPPAMPVSASAATVGGQGASTYVVTPEMLVDLRSVLDGLKLAGAPSLARAIEREEARLGVDSWAGHHQRGGSDARDRHGDWRPEDLRSTCGPALRADPGYSRHCDLHQLVTDFTRHPPCKASEGVPERATQRPLRRLPVGRRPGALSMMTRLPPPCLSYLR